MVTPLAILNRKLELHNNEKIEFTLVQWDGYPTEEATWERLEDSGDKVSVEAGRSDTNSTIFFHN